MAVTKLSPIAAMVVFLALTVSLLPACAADSDAYHHVVGDDRGWDTTSDVAAWAAARIFLVGDSLWFTYSAAREKIVEVASAEEYEACDLSNPIKIYSDGLSKVSLDREGTRYFASATAENCKKGLKLPVDVKPRSAAVTRPLARSEPAAVAAAPMLPPPAPSASVEIAGAAAAAFGALLGGALLLWF